MLLYNVTIGIDKDIEEEWIDWIKINHIPAVMKTGLFVDSRMYKILHDQEDGTISYSIQYFAKTIANINQYLQKFAPQIVEEHRQKFLNKHVVFQTLLEEIK
jgi:hypothetical protein